MSDDFRHLISTLKYLSFIKKNEKICTKDRSVYKNNWYDFFYRTVVMPENRFDTTNFLETNIDMTFQFLDACESPDKVFTVIECLQESIQGIENLRYTYQHDACMKGKLDSILIDIKSKIAEIKSRESEKHTPNNCNV